MKKRPLTETQFDRLMPDALDPNGNTEPAEIDWQAHAIGSGVASVIALLLMFADDHFADQLFKGRSFEFAQSMSYCLMALTIGLGIYCLYACVRAYAPQRPSKQKKKLGQDKTGR